MSAVLLTTDCREPLARQERRVRKVTWALDSKVKRVIRDPRVRLDQLERPDHTCRSNLLLRSPDLLVFLEKRETKYVADTNKGFIFIYFYSTFHQLLLSLTTANNCIPLHSRYEHYDIFILCLLYRVTWDWMAPRVSQDSWEIPEFLAGLV